MTAERYFRPQCNFKLCEALRTSCDGCTAYPPLGVTSEYPQMGVKGGYTPEGVERTGQIVWSGGRAGGG